MTAGSDWRVRTFAAVVAVAAASGLIVQFFAVLEANGGYGANLWVLVRFFTILTNLLVAGVFAGMAAGVRPPWPAWIVSGAVFSILLVGVIYALLLHGTAELNGGGQIANVLLHMVTPILAPLYWLAFARKGGLRYHDPLIWVLYPAAYVLYALGRGAIDGLYPYPFINMARIGLAQTAINCATIGAGFLIAGVAVVWLDHRLAR